MKAPLITQEQRFILKWHRSKYHESLPGAAIELFLARKKLQRAICRFLKLKK